MYEKYEELREGLGYLAVSLFAGAFILSLCFNHPLSAKEQVSLLFNVTMFLCILWTVTSGAAKMLMMTKQKEMMGLNGAALGLLVTILLLSRVVPVEATDPQVAKTIVYQAYSLVTTVCVVLWFVLDICEIVFSLIDKGLQTTL